MVDIVVPDVTEEAEKASRDGQAAMEEAYGSSQIGPFDYVPPLGFREYWYPGVWARDVGRKKPTMVKMLGEDIVFFRGKNGEVVAITDWCPHRSARFSLGVSEFPGTITCPYHGYTFDGTGQCVAGLIDHPESSVVPKMRARAYPTSEHKGIVFVWMGETDAVPLEEGLPPELWDDRNDRYTRVKLWEVNWTEPMNQGIDWHGVYLHRNSMKFNRIFNKDLRFFRPREVYFGGVRIVGEDDNRFLTAPKKRVFGQAYYAGVDGKWPKHIWWRILPRRKSDPRNETSLLDGRPFAQAIELPSIIRTGAGSERVHLFIRWQVPVDEEHTRVWSFNIGRRPKTLPARWFKNVWYYFWRKWDLRATNEKEDLVVFMKDRMRYDIPQKLGAMDAGVIYFRRHLAQRSRDFRRLGGAIGTHKQPPTRTAAEWRKSLSEATDAAPQEAR